MCSVLGITRVKGVSARKVQCDEIWTYVFKKQGRISVDENAAGIGDQYVFVGIDSDTKLVISHLVGKRDGTSAYNFMRDLKDRVVTRVQLTTDGFRPYINAVDDTFGSEVDYAQLVKIYGQPKASAATSSKLLRACACHRGDSNGCYRTTESDVYFYVSRRAAEPNHADANAAIYSAHQCLFKEAGQPQGRDCSALRLVQLRSRSPNPTSDSCDGIQSHRSCLDSR